MANGAKVLITEDAKFDLEAYRWDDNRFSDMLIRENPMAPEEALNISRFIRQEIGKMDLTTITLPMIEKLIETKLLEFGLGKMQPLRLDKSIFVRNGVDLTDNARQVLERRYLKKDADGRIIEAPEEMFRRVARHIAEPEAAHGLDVAAAEEKFYRLLTSCGLCRTARRLRVRERRWGSWRLVLCCRLKMIWAATRPGSSRPCAMLP
jgi:ribonucleoside-diphosphate reductase alpha chain